MELKTVSDLTRAPSPRKFLDWQAEYAKRKIATFPVAITAEGKKPLVSNYQRIGLPASAQIARRFADARGIAFIAGLRNGITVLDIDEPGNRPLQHALERHSYSPVIVQTASGKHHVWYRYNGDRRAVRPEPGNEIDILGDGMVTAPPSHGPKGNYQFIAGSLDDLHRLPIMRNVPERALHRPAPLAQMRQPRTTGRNDALWRFCMRTARRCDNLDQLLDHAHQFNSELPSPLQEEETVKTAASAWRYETTGKNQFGQHGAYFTIEMIEGLVRNRDTDAFALLAYLRAHNGPWADFWITNGLAKTFGCGDKRLAAARDRLLERSDVVLVKPPHKGSPAIYQWGY
jgi:hypothetical protein